MHKGDGIEVTAEELVMLTALLGSEFVIGLDDPYTGYLEEERERAVRTTQLRLMEQGILVFTDDDGEMGIEENHAELAAACGFARTMCHLRIAARGGGPEPGILHDASYYFTQELLVEKRKSGHSPLRYELQSIGLPFESGYLLAERCFGAVQAFRDGEIEIRLTALTWDGQKEDWYRSEARFQAGGGRSAIYSVVTKAECSLDELAEQIARTVLQTLEPQPA